MTSQAPDPDGFSGRRVVLLAALLVAAGAVFELAVRRSPAGAASLTLAGAVAIINFRWLEGVLQRVIQPGEPRFDRSSLLRILGRMVLLVALLLTLLWVPQVEPAAVALGVSALVVAVIVEGTRWARAGGG
jgi:hypothetical protein